MRLTQIQCLNLEEQVLLLEECRRQLHSNTLLSTFKGLVLCILSLEEEDFVEYLV